MPTKFYISLLRVKPETYYRTRPAIATNAVSDQ